LRMTTRNDLSNGKMRDEAVEEAMSPSREGVLTPGRVACACPVCGEDSCPAIGLQVQVSRPVRVSSPELPIRGLRVTEVGFR